MPSKSSTPADEGGVRSSNVVRLGAGDVPTDSGSRRRWVPMAIGMAALLLAYTGWQVFRWPSGHRELISDLSFVPVSLAAIGGAWAAARRCRAQPRLRSAWRLIAAGVRELLGRGHHLDAVCAFWE